MTSLFWLFLFCPLSYLMGSINFSVIISKYKKTDIRKQGSGNPGTMNMARTFGAKWGVLVLILDGLKGGIPALAAILIFGFSTSAGRIALYAMGLSAVIGHMLPVFYKFKGGKGVATTFGIFCIANPAVSAIFIAVCFVSLIVLEYGALTSFIFISALIIAEGLNPLNHANITVCILLFCIFLLIWFKHRTNITRLLIGKENKVTLFKSLKNKKQMKLEEKLFREVQEGKEEK